MIALLPQRPLAASTPGLCVWPLFFFPHFLGDRLVKAYAFNASRWHKIAERLSAKAAQAAEEARAAFANTRVDGFAGDEQTHALLARADEGALALKTHELASSAVSIIRAALGSANAANGVSALMAEAESVKRRVKLLKEIVAAQKPEMVSVEGLPSYKPFSEGAGRSMYHREERGAILVRVLSRSKEAELKAEIEALEARGYALADSANDRNREPVSVELDERAAALAGLE